MGKTKAGLPCTPSIWANPLLWGFKRDHEIMTKLVKNWGGDPFPARQPIPLGQKIDNFVAYTMREARINAAKKLAGNDWPDEDY